MLPILLLACNNAPIEDGAQIGPLTQVKTFFTSALVGVPPSGGPIVFDAGYNRAARQIERQLQGDGISLDDVQMVFLTHSHTDHIRGLEALDATVIAHEDEVALLGEEGITVDRVVTDGESVDAGGWPVEVFHVPGHTPGNVAYLVQGVLVMGDTALQERDGTVGPPPERFSADPAQAETELCRLIERLRARASEIEHVAYAHSGASTFAALAEADCPAAAR